MTPLSAYFLTTTTPNGNTQVDILTSGYVSYQVYADNTLLIESTATSFVAIIRPNQKVDVLGLVNGEQGTDFSSTLSDQYGDKVQFNLPYSFYGQAVKVYSDNQTGVIDYGRPMAMAAATELGDPTLGWMTFTAAQWQTFSAAQWQTFGAVSSQQVLLTITRRLKIGQWKFALVNYSQSDNYHEPYLIQQTISTRPDQITPFIESYNAELDELIISTGDDGEGQYSIYAASWGASQFSINLTTPIGAAISSPITLYGFRSSQTNNTRYFIIRKSVNGVEEQNFNFITFTVVDGEWSGSIPLQSYGLTVTLLSDNRPQLQWKYQVGTVAPDGFHIYATGHYSSIIETVPYTGEGVISAILPSINEVSSYTVRAYRGALEDSSTDSVSVSPLNQLVLVTGYGSETWRDQ